MKTKLFSFLALLGALLYSVGLYAGNPENGYGWTGPDDMFAAFMTDAGATDFETLSYYRQQADPLASPNICGRLTNAAPALSMDKWAWLKAYIEGVHADQASSGASTLSADGSGAAWRYAVGAFFVDGQRSGWPKSANFADCGVSSDQMLAAWGFTWANSSADSYVLSFNLYNSTSADSGSSYSALTSASDIFTDASHVASIDAASKVYAARMRDSEGEYGCGLKFGSASAAGSITFTLDAPCDSFVVSAAQYNATTVSVYVNDEEFALTAGNKVFTTRTFAGTQKITLMTKSSTGTRAYVNYIEVYSGQSRKPYYLMSDLFDWDFNDINKFVNGNLTVHMPVGQWSFYYVVDDNWGMLYDVWSLDTACSSANVTPYYDRGCVALNVEHEQDVVFTLTQNGWCITGDFAPIPRYYMTGEGDAFGNWAPDAIEMTPQGSNQYYYSLYLTKGHYEFKITKDGTWTENWGGELETDNYSNYFATGVSDGENIVLDLYYDMEVSFIISSDSTSNVYIQIYTSKQNMPTTAEFPYFEDFRNNQYNAGGWSQFGGKLDYVLAGDTSALYPSQDWSISYRSAAYYLCTWAGLSNQYLWAVAPTVTLPKTTNPIELSFDYMWRRGTADADDVFAVLVTTDECQTWNLLAQWTGDEQNAMAQNVRTNMTLDLSEYAGQSVRVAFYTGSDESQYGDYWIGLTNVKICEIDPMCQPATNLQIGNYGFDPETGYMTTELSWNTTGYQSFIVEYVYEWNSDFSNVIDRLEVEDATSVVLNVYSGNSYYVRVAPACEPNNWTTYYFQVPMIYTLNYYEDFYGYAFNNGWTTDGWEEMRTESGYYYDTHVMSQLGNGWSGNVQTMTSPLLMLNENANVPGAGVKFRLWQSRDYNAYNPETIEDASGRSLTVAITTDGGNTWNKLYKWGDTEDSNAAYSEISTTYDDGEVRLDLSQYANQIVQLQFIHEMAVDTTSQSDELVELANYGSNPLLVDDWAIEYVLSDGGIELAAAGATAGDLVRFYFTPTDSSMWYLQVLEGHFSVSREYLFAGYYDGYNGYAELTLTQDMLNYAFTQQGWGGTFAVLGDNVLLNKIELVKKHSASNLSTVHLSSLEVKQGDIFCREFDGMGRHNVTGTTINLDWSRNIPADSQQKYIVRLIGESRLTKYGWYEFVEYPDSLVRTWTTTTGKLTIDGLNPTTEYALGIKAECQANESWKWITTDALRVRYELNGGMFNDCGWMSKQDMYWTMIWQSDAYDANSLEYYQSLPDSLKASAVDELASYMSLYQSIFTYDLWSWLKTYIMDVTAADPTATVLSEDGIGMDWNLAIAAFFIEANHPATADFTMAGKPAAFEPVWGQTFGNPEIVTETTVLKAPHYWSNRLTFAGWYDNPEFTGEPVVSVEPGMDGYLYAKWKTKTIAEAKAMPLYDYVVTSGVVTYVRDRNVYIQDETGGLLVYVNNADQVAAVGQNVAYEGTNYLYGGAPELNSAYKYYQQPKDSAAMPQPLMTSLAELVADPMAHVFERVYVRDLIIDHYTGNGDVYVSDSTNVIRCYYMRPDQEKFPVGTEINLTAIAGYYNGLQFVGDVNGFELASNHCGPDTYWEVVGEQSDTLKITGEGFMYDYQTPEARPWNSYANDITVIDIPEGVTTIGDNTLANTAITTIVVPSSVTSIGNDAFAGCDELENVYIKDINDWLNIDFGNVDANPLNYAETLYEGMVINSLLPGDVVDQEGGIDLGGGIIGVVPGGIPTGGISIDQIQKVVKDVVVENGVAEIKAYAFAGYETLRSITMPLSLTSIGDYAFANCANLEVVNLPANLEYLGAHAFDGCNKLTTINVPAAVLTVAEKALANCTMLNKVTINAIPAMVEADAFNGSSVATATLNAPLADLEQTTGTSVWSDFGTVEKRSYTLNVSQLGVATVFLNYAAAIPAGVQVYTLTYDGVSGMTETHPYYGTILPANTGVVVRANAGAYTFEEVSGEGVPAVVTDLSGWVHTMTTPNDVEIYVLANTAAGVGFAHYVGSVLTGYKAFLVVSSSMNAPAIIEVIEGTDAAETIDEATGIEDLNAGNANAGFYNVLGMPVSADYQGVQVTKGSKKMLR